LVASGAGKKRRQKYCEEKHLDWGPPYQASTTAQKSKIYNRNKMKGKEKKEFPQQSSQIEEKLKRRGIGDIHSETLTSPGENYSFNKT